MPKYCAESVDYMGTRHGMIRAFLSTKAVETGLHQAKVSVKPRFITTFLPIFPLHLSPPKTVYLPLIERLFYPVSTAPINYCNQMKMKER